MNSLILTKPSCSKCHRFRLLCWFLPVSVLHRSQNSKRLFTAKTRLFICRVLASQSSEYFLSELKDVAKKGENVKEKEERGKKKRKWEVTRVTKKCKIKAKQACVSRETTCRQKGGKCHFLKGGNIFFGPKY